MRTITFKLCIHCICKFHIQAIQYLLQHLLRCMSVIQHAGNRRDLLDILFQFIQHLIRYKWHYLHNKSTCTVYCVVLVHQYSKAHRRRNLFAGCKIIRQIFCDLTCLQNSLSNIWFFQSHIFNNI